MHRFRVLQTQTGVTHERFEAVKQELLHSVKMIDKSKAQLIEIETDMAEMVKRNQG